MSESRRRRQIAESSGVAMSSLRCPVPRCRSTSVLVQGPETRLAQALAISHDAAPVPVCVCQACSCLWLPREARTSGDPFISEPCSNCRWLDGPPAALDGLGWDQLIERLRKGQAPGDPEALGFWCPCDVPIRLAETDRVRAFDFPAIGGILRGRPCSMFLLALSERMKTPAQQQEEPAA